MDVITLLLGYFIIMNLIGFALMGIDKYRAKKRSFRIPEATLFIVAIIGGSIGSIIGMYAEWGVDFIKCDNKGNEN